MTEDKLLAKKAIECAETLVRFCAEQNGCQNCIFRKFGCDSWECHINANILKYVIYAIKEQAERK